MNELEQLILSYDFKLHYGIQIYEDYLYPEKIYQLDNLILVLDNKELDHNYLVDINTNEVLMEFFTDGYEMLFDYLENELGLSLINNALVKMARHQAKNNKL